MKSILVIGFGSVLEIKNGNMLAFGEPGEIYGPSPYDKMFLSKYATAASSKHPVLFFRESVHFGRGSCVLCVFSSHSFWTSMDVPAGVTQEEGNTGFSIHLLSAVLALIFLARRIQPFLSLVDREVEFCVLTI